MLFRSNKATISENSVACRLCIVIKFDLISNILIWLRDKKTIKIVLFMRDSRCHQKSLKKPMSI